MLFKVVHQLDINPTPPTTASAQTSQQFQQTRAENNCTEEPTIREYCELEFHSFFQDQDLNVRSDLKDALLSLDVYSRGGPYVPASMLYPRRLCIGNQR